MKSIGFKEWALVCQALGRGEQSIILRKGGIAEGRDGFSFQYQEFFLFPTFFHEQIEKVRTNLSALPSSAQNETIQIQLYAKVESALRIDSLAIITALAPLHILAPEVVRERFEYLNGRLSVALVRIFELAQPWILRNEKRFGGCRSWLELPAAPERQMNPVLSEEAYLGRRRQFDAIVKSTQD